MLSSWSLKIWMALGGSTRLSGGRSPLALATHTHATTANPTEALSATTLNLSVMPYVLAGTVPALFFAGSLIFFMETTVALRRMKGELHSSLSVVWAMT